MTDSVLQSLLINEIYEASPEGILVVDDKNIILSHNHQFIEIWQLAGLRLHGENGSTIGLAIDPVLSAMLEQVKDKQAFLAQNNKLLANPQSKDTCEIELQDGRTIQRHTTMLNSSSGKYLGRVWFFRDITKFKHIEYVQDRMEAQKKYHTILKTATDGFWTVNKDGRLLEVNDAYCSMTGFSREELLNMRIPDLEAKEASEDTRQHIEKIIAQGHDRFETKHRCKDGCIIDVEISTQYMPLVDQMFVVFVKDISERKRIEADLLAAKEEAERANNAKSQFLSGVSHELRTPLNAILGFAQLLEMNANLNSSEQNEYVQHIMTAGGQLLALVNEVLDLSRIDAGKTEFNIRPLRIAEIASSCVDQVSVAMQDKNNIMIENTIKDTSILVQADDLRMRQVLINLLSNAVKYNRENGRVTLSSIIENKGRLKIKVHDTGTGIAKEKLSLLFTPFERIDQKHGTISGVEIGLYITKRLIEEMQGSVGVESEQGKGSTFWFDIPLTA
jgi:PAS domain S-box-containing protein